MKYLFLFIILSPFFAFSKKLDRKHIIENQVQDTISDQDPTFEETLNYIKKNVNEFQYKDPAGEIKHSSIVQLDKYGKLTITKVINDKITKTESYYLKSVDTIYTEYIHSYMSRMFIDCKSSDDILIIDKKENNKVSTNYRTALLFSSLIGANKIKNAFNYLIKLAKENPNFREKDLF